MVRRGVISEPKPRSVRVAYQRGQEAVARGSRVSEPAPVSRQAEACLEPVTDPVTASAGELAVRSACYQNDVASRGFRHSVSRKRTVPPQLQIEITRISAFTEAMEG